MRECLESGFTLIFTKTKNVQINHFSHMISNLRLVRLEDFYPRQYRFHIRSFDYHFRYIQTQCSRFFRYIQPYNFLLPLLEK